MYITELLRTCMFYLGQGLEDQSSLSGLSVLLVGLRLQSHLLSLRLAHGFDGGGLRLTDLLDLLCLSLSDQHRLLPDAGGNTPVKAAPRSL